eukprot:COSAG04_NODE_55_length_30619_cov_12.038991_22_plen_173_part_00
MLCLLQGPGDRFKSMVTSPAEKSQLEWAAKMFRQHDDDGNEVLDADEFRGLHAAMVERGIFGAGLSCEEALRSLDRNGDGEINVEEFLVWLLDRSKGAEGTGGAPPVSLTRPASEPSKPESSEDGAVAVTFTEAGSLGIAFGSRKDAPGGVAVIPPYIKALKPGGMAEACEF